MDNSQEKCKCPQCDGGWNTIEEDGQLKAHPCYHCNTTGLIPPATFRLDRIDAMTELLARDELERIKKNANENPDGEGWAFGAAESRMSVAEYDNANFVTIWEKFHSAFRWIEWNHQELTNVLLERLVPLPVEEPPKLEPTIEPDPPSTEEIPF